jgi:hypothetical protein
MNWKGWEAVIRPIILEFSREGLSESTKDLKTVGVQAWTPAGNLQNAARSHTAGSQNAGNFQITRLFHYKEDTFRIHSYYFYVTVQQKDTLT